jgi:hypothetical protein
MAEPYDWDVDAHAFDEVRYEEHRERVLAEDEVEEVEPELEPEDEDDPSSD